MDSKLPLLQMEKLRPRKRMSHIQGHQAGEAQTRTQQGKYKGPEAGTKYELRPMG